MDHPHPIATEHRADGHGSAQKSGQPVNHAFVMEFGAATTALSCGLPSQECKFDHQTLESSALLNYGAKSHLTNVERRVQQLESLLASLLPGVDTDEVLSRPETSSIAAAPSSMHSSPAETVQTARMGREETPAVEVMPKEADGFDWREEATGLASLTDGMASLSVAPSGTGYLGERSTNTLIGVLD